MVITTIVHQIVYYFGNESYKPLGYIEYTEDDLSLFYGYLKKHKNRVTKIRLVEDDTHNLDSIGQDDFLVKDKNFKYDRKFSKVESAKEVVYITDEKGQIWAFGSGNKGQLGLDQRIHKINKPMNIHKFRSAIKEPVKQISACHNHTFAVTQSNKLYGWGDAEDGKLLDLEQNIVVLKPTLIKLNQFVDRSQQVNEGDQSNLNQSVMSNKNIYKSQSNILNRKSNISQNMVRSSQSSLSKNYDEINTTRNYGNAHASQFSPSIKHTHTLSQKNITESIRETPTRRKKQGQKYSQISQKNDSKGFLPSLQKNSSYSVHMNSNKNIRNSGQQADDTFTNRSIKGSLFSIPQNNSKEPMLIATGSSHSLVYINGNLYSFGREQNGLLGIGQIKFEQTKIPQPISSLNNVKIVGIAANFFHSLAWDSEGSIYSWGDGTHGQLGHPIEKGYQFNRLELVPKRIQVLQGKKVIQAACGKYYSSAITIEGELYGWGKGEYSTKDHSIDNMVSLMDSIYPQKLIPEGINSSHVKFIKVSCGVSHNATIDQFGRLYTWGDSTEYCLGHGKLQDLYQPKMVKILKNKVTIDASCGDRFTVVIQEEDVSGRKANIVEQFNERNISNIRQKIKNLYDYTKMKINIGIEEDKSVEQSQIQIKEYSMIEQNGSDINISLSQIVVPETPSNNRNDKSVSPHKSKLPKILQNQFADVNSQFQNSFLVNSPVNNNFGYNTGFKLDLEEFVDRQGNVETDFSESQNNFIRNLKSLLDKDIKNTKTYKTIQEYLIYF